MDIVRNVIFRCRCLKKRRIHPIIITIFGYTTLYDFFGGKLFNSSLAALVAPMPFIYNVSGILLLIGIIVGMIGSYQAVRKYLKI